MLISMLVVANLPVSYNMEVEIKRTFLNVFINIRSIYNLNKYETLYVNISQYVLKG